MLYLNFSLLDGYTTTSEMEQFMWDERYKSEVYAYGTEPNDFLIEVCAKLPRGDVLCLAEGEGRNAVWLASQGFAVTAVDSSGVGLEKAHKLANERGVKINTVKADLADFEIGVQRWDVIVSIFCHLPPALRRDVHQRCVSGLRAGGMMLLEAYTPDQLNYNTGGPPKVEMMMDAQSLDMELNGLEFLHLEECVRDLHEGEFHNGTGSIVQALAIKPKQ
ncbi:MULTISPECIES: SAM-dependent methyltransferase [Gammaproteobacteria]|nr:class I SAM-dependent methyltransferase [Marinobacter vinifirmus]